MSKFKVKQHSKSQRNFKIIDVESNETHIYLTYVSTDGLKGGYHFPIAKNGTDFNVGQSVAIEYINDVVTEIWVNGRQILK